MKKKRLRRRNSKRNYLALLILLAILSIILIAVSLSLSKKQVILNPVASPRNVDSEKIENMLLNKNISYLSINKNNQLYYVISLKDNGEVIVSTQKNISDQLGSLQLILNRLTIEGKRFKSLDFRYDKPVISY